MLKLEYRALTPKELASELASLPGWTSTGDEIFRVFEFGRYQEGLVFAVSVGYLADRLDHHPDIEIGYKKVKVSSSTPLDGRAEPIRL